MPRRSDSVECPHADVCQRCDCAGEDDVCFPRERDFFELRTWLMRTVGSASTLKSAQRVVEAAVADAIKRNREAS